MLKSFIQIIYKDIDFSNIALLESYRYETNIQAMPFKLWFLFNPSALKISLVTFYFMISLITYIFGAWILHELLIFKWVLISLSIIFAYIMIQFTFVMNKPHVKMVNLYDVLFKGVK
jgi:hypothetical protein